MTRGLLPGNYANELAKQRKMPDAPLYIGGSRIARRGGSRHDVELVSRSTGNLVEANGTLTVHAVARKNEHMEQQPRQLSSARAPVFRRYRVMYVHELIFPLSTQPIFCTRRSSVTPQKHAGGTVSPAVVTSMLVQPT